MLKMIFVNLPVTDLPRAKTFYEAIGFTNKPKFTDDTAACMVLSDSIHLMLLTHDKFMQFSPRPISDAKTACQVLLCIGLDSRDAVDDIVTRAKTAGANVDVTPADDYGFMYGRNFEDFDGHLWAPMWMEPDRCGQRSARHGQSIRRSTIMSKITPCLWFATEAEEAANFYVSLLPESRITHVQRSPMDYPGGTKDAVLVVEFELAGQSYMGLNGGSSVPFSNAVSFSINCEDQAEVDRLWDALGDGGTPQACGWITDRYGLPWQIVPRILPQLLADPDPAKAQRAMAAMMTMVKLDVAALEKAAAG